MCQTDTFVYAVILDKEHEVEIPTISKDHLEQFKRDIEVYSCDA